VSESQTIYGLLAEFESEKQLLAAVRASRLQGYRKMDAFSPVPVHGLAEELGFTKTRLPLIVFLGGLAGMIGGYMLQYGTAAFVYPLNIGGRPLHSWPAFIPITFETTVLIAAFSAVVGMIALNGLPRPYHPLFNVKRFKLASRNRFFLAIESSDPLFDAVDTKDFMAGLDARGVYEVEH